MARRRKGARRIGDHPRSQGVRAEVLPLQSSELTMLREVSQLDWAQIEPAIFGTLFERGLDADKRTQLVLPRKVVSLHRGRFSSAQLAGGAGARRGRLVRIPQAVARGDAAHCCR
jgi:hypothetical protein